MERRVERSLYKRSLYKWVQAFLCEWTILLSLFYLMYKYPYVYVLVPSYFLLASRQHALGVLGHECVHRLVHRKRWVNTLLGMLCLSPLLTSYQGYKRSHILHHRYLGTPRDTEPVHRKRWGKWTYPLTGTKAFLYFLGDSLLITSLRHVYEAERNLKPTRYVYYIPVFIWELFDLYMLFTPYWVPIVLWHLSLLGPFWFLNRLRWHKEHIEPGVLTSLQAPSRLSRALLAPHNIWNHRLHHAQPYRPFWTLTELPIKDTHHASSSR